MAGHNNEASLPVVDCEGCGVCCLHMGYPSFVRASEGASEEALGNQPDEEHWQNLPDDLKRDLLSYINHYEHPTSNQLDGPCYWFDPQSRRCKHYEHRPRVCREFAAGGEDCRGWRRHYEIDAPPGGPS